MQVDGIFVEDYRAYCANWVANIKKITKEAELTILDPIDGYPSAWQRVPSGVPFVSARSSIISYYLLESDGAGGFEFIASSQGNEAIVEQMKDKFKDDVVSQTLFNYFRYTPRYDSLDELIGTDIVQVAKVNVGGSLPDVLKSRLSTTVSRIPLAVTQDIRDAKK